MDFSRLSKAALHVVELMAQGHAIEHDLHSFEEGKPVPPEGVIVDGIGARFEVDETIWKEIEASGVVTFDYMPSESLGWRTIIPLTHRKATSEALSSYASQISPISFPHDGKNILNPFKSGCGSFEVDPSHYGFEAISTGGGSNALYKNLGDEYILITQDDQIPLKGADPSSVIIGLYGQDGQPIRSNTLAEAIAAAHAEPGRISDVGGTLSSPYAAVRVATMYRGLVPIGDFDAVAIGDMTNDPDAVPGEPGEYIPAEEGDPVVAFSVRLRYRRGGDEAVADYPFHPDLAGDRQAAERRAADHAFSLVDMIRMADPSIEINHVLGEQLHRLYLADARAGDAATPEPGI